MDVDGVDDNGTTRDDVVDAEIEGTARFGGLGEFFVPWDLCIGRTKKKGSQKENTKNNLGMMMMMSGDGKWPEVVVDGRKIELSLVMTMPSFGSTA